MLKQTFTYKDWDEREQTDILWFNITKDEMVGLRHLVPRLEKLDAIVNEPSREMSMDEIAELLDVVKMLIDAAYGERPDPKHFDKSPETLKKFKQTAAYSEFIFQLFEQPAIGIAFMRGVWPREIVDGLETANMQTVELPQPVPVEFDSSVGRQPVIIEDAWIRENREPTSVEVRGMNQYQLAEAMKAKIRRDNP